MSGPSGENTKDSKIQRVLTRQTGNHAEVKLQLLNIVTLLRLNHETDTQTIAEMAATIKLLAAENMKLAAANLELTATNTLLSTVAQSLEGQLNRIRKYVGSILFKRRQIMAGTIPILHDAQEPKWSGKPHSPPLSAAAINFPPISTNDTGPSQSDVAARFRR